MAEMSVDSEYFSDVWCLSRNSEWPHDSPNIQHLPQCPWRFKQPCDMHSFKLFLRFPTHPITIPVFWNNSKYIYYCGCDPKFILHIFLKIRASSDIFQIPHSHFIFLFWPFLIFSLLRISNLFFLFFFFRLSNLGVEIPQYFLIVVVQVTDLLYADSIRVNRSRLHSS